MVTHELAVQCPECGDVIGVPLAIGVDVVAGDVDIDAQPDLADVWAHAWTHEGERR